jgi:Domain of unknown function (DUF5666)
MLKKIRQVSFVVGMAVVLMALVAFPAFPKGNDVQFHGTVTRVDLSNAATASITLRIMGFDVPVRVTADTEVESEGDDLELSDIKVGDFVKVSGFFANSAIQGREITILDRGDGQFRLRGLITAVGSNSNGTLITVLGIQVVVNADTEIERRGEGGPIGAMNLAVNQFVDVRGFHSEGQFIATRIKVGNREEDLIRVNFAGKITAVASDRFMVDTEGGSSALVLITPTTVMTGTPAVGKFAEVRGTLNSFLQVVANRVTVRANKDDDDDGPPRPLTKFDKKISIRPVGPTSSVVGEAEAELEQKGTDVQQEFEVEFKHALATTDYNIRIDIAGFGTLSLGTVRTNREGEGHLKLKTQLGPLNLATLLPSGKTVRDITKVQILTAGGVVVAEGAF